MHRVVVVSDLDPVGLAQHALSVIVKNNLAGARVVEAVYHEHLKTRWRKAELIVGMKAELVGVEQPRSAAVVRYLHLQRLCIAGPDG